jgi:hypothetical protein
MRTPLRLFVLATAAMAWAASRPVPVWERARHTGSVAAAEVVAPGPPAAEVRDAGTDPESSAEVIATLGATATSDTGRDPAEWAPLEVVVVVAESGAPVPMVRPTVRSRPARGGPFDNGGSVQRGVRAEVIALVAPPEGFVADYGGKYENTAHVSRRAWNVRVLAPLRREAEISVRVVTADGQAAPGARVIRAIMGGSEPQVWPRVVEIAEIPEPEIPEEEFVEAEGGEWEVVAAKSGPAGGDGWMRVRGLPHFLDERYWIIASAGKHEGFSGVTLGRFGEARTAVVRLPPEPSEVGPPGFACNSAMGLG